MSKRILVAAIVSLATSTVSARADFVNTFYGTVIASDSFGDVTTSDTGNPLHSGGYFGGGNLLGKSFVLSFTVHTAALYSGESSAVGSSSYGSYYFPPDPFTSTLTINGQSFSITDSSDGSYGPGFFGANEVSLQTFNYNSGYQLQTEGMDVNIDATHPFPFDLTKKLPAWQASNGDFKYNYAAFYTNLPFYYSRYDEKLVLGILSVNAPPAAAVPEPATVATFGAALGLLTLIRRRRRD